MLSTQRPIALPTPHMHPIYTNLPATTRRAANVPFLIGRAAPFAHPPTPTPTTTTSSIPSSGVRRPTTPTRRNAISYHPPPFSSTNPFASEYRPRPPRAPSTTRSSPQPTLSPLPTPTSTITSPLSPPAPISKPKPTTTPVTAPPCRLVSAGHITGPTLAAPLCYPTAPARDSSSRLVASLLLNRSARARPMRPPTMTRRGVYVRSGLSVCVGTEVAAA